MLGGPLQIATYLLAAITAMYATGCTARTHAAPETLSPSPTPRIPPSLTVLVADEGGGPLPGVTVVAYRSSGSPVETARAATDARGRAVFQDLEDGLYEVRSELPPFCQDRALRQIVSRNSAATVSVTMTMRWTRCDFAPVRSPTPSPAPIRLQVLRTPSSGNPR